MFVIKKDGKYLKKDGTLTDNPVEAKWYPFWMQAEDRAGRCKGLATPCEDVLEAVMKEMNELREQLKKHNGNQTINRTGD